MKVKLSDLQTQFLSKHWPMYTKAGQLHRSGTIWDGLVPLLSFPLGMHKIIMHKPFEPMIVTLSVRTQYFFQSRGR